MSRILAISGSLRAESFNTALLGALPALAPEGMTFELYKGLDELPHFNQDLEADVPEPVARLREAVVAADGVVIATPEYNRSIPGVLKNAIDWASRPYGAFSLYGKPVAVIASSPGAQGGIRAHADLTRILRNISTFVVNAPEVAIPEVHTRLGVDAADVAPRAAPPWTAARGPATAMLLAGNHQYYSSVTTDAAVPLFGPRRVSTVTWEEAR